MKKHKLLAEFIAKKETEYGSIDVMQSIKFMQEIAKVAEKYAFDAYCKGYPKDLLDYKPTGKTITIKTLEDIAKLTADQYEMFLIDLRSWVDYQKSIEVLKKYTKVKIDPGMIWIDDGGHHATTKATVEFTNKL